MQITIHCPNPQFTQIVRNYFADNNVQCMISNNETEVSLFDIDREQADYLLHAFIKQFKLKNTTRGKAAA